MSIPEISIEMKQDLRPEKILPARNMVRQSAHSENEMVSVDAIHKQSKAQADNQSTDFSKEKLNSLISEAEEHLEANDVNLKFKILEETNTVQVEIIDSDGKTIRKIPGDDFLKLSKSLKNLGQGFLDEVS